LSAAAQQAGLAAWSIPTLQIEGNNKPGLARQIAQPLADAGINLNFLVPPVIGRRYAATIGFETEAEAGKAAGLIKKAAARRKK
jgi:hypothetical protein